MFPCRRSGPVVLRRPASAATALVILLTVLTGAGSPANARPERPFPAVGELAAMNRRSGHLGVVAGAGALTGAQVVRAVALRDGLPVDQRDRLDAVLREASPTVGPYLAAAFAAGHSVAELAGFAPVLAGQGPRWLSSRLRPIKPAQTGVVEFKGTSIRQYDDTTCGSAAVLAARALTDPLYAWQLTTGGRPGTEAESDESFRRRLRKQEERIHDQTDVLWPQFAGTPPWGISERLNRDRSGLGARYRWTPTVHRAPASAGRVLGQALVAANHGYPVPLLIGDVIPRHYVLLLRSDRWGASIYEPTAGAIVLVSPADLAGRDFRRVGYPRLHGVILPAPPRTG